MTLHPTISRDELTAYCELCHEHGVKSVKVDVHTANAIKTLMFGNLRAFGVNFKVKQ